MGRKNKADIFKEAKLMAQNELFKLTAKQITEGNFDKVILPLGSAEAHAFGISGGHLRV